MAAKPQPCPRCAGQKLVPNPAWKEFDREDETTLPFRAAQFAREHGPELMPCEECRDRSLIVADRRTKRRNRRAA